MSTPSPDPARGADRDPATTSVKGSSRGSSKGRRIAEKPARARRTARAPRTRDSSAPGRAPRGSAPLGVGAGAVLLAGLVALACVVVGIGPSWLDGAGAVAVSSALAVALGYRTGGRPLVAGLLALVIGVAAVVIDGPILQTGAAVLTVVVGGVLAVMATVPAVSFVRAVGEVLVATLISGFAAVAAVGFEPTVVEPRFDYVSILLAMGLVVVLVHRLGAGIHGLGRRGLIAVLVGVTVLVLTLVYAELLRRYGAGPIVSPVLDFAGWTEDRIGAFPRPLVVLLGIPALVWGCFQRARRRQGWWVCAFGVTATVPLAQSLLEPDSSFLEAGLRGAYSLVLGLAIGFLLVRLDLALTAPRGRRGRRAEEAAAHRPEPSRFAEL